MFFLNNSDSFSSPPPDCCPFNSLHEVVKWKIMKQLKFRDYRNLAFICKEWYQTAVSAPLSVKPDVHFLCLDMNYGSYVTKSDDGYLDPNVLSFQLVNRVKCENLKISEEICIDLQGFILFHRSHFEFHNILIEMDYMEEEDYVFIEPLFDLAPGIEWRSSWKNEKFLLRFLENHILHRNIVISRSKTTECFNLVLQQWIKGDRPRLNYFSYCNRKPNEWHEFTERVEEFVQNQRVDDSVYFSAKIVVPGLPNLLLSGSNVYCKHFSSQTIWFRRVEN